MFGLGPDSVWGQTVFGARQCLGPDSVWSGARQCLVWGKTVFGLGPDSVWFRVTCFLDYLTHLREHGADHQDPEAAEEPGQAVALPALNQHPYLRCVRWVICSAPSPNHGLYQTRGDTVESLGEVD